MRRNFPRQCDYPKLVPVKDAQYHVVFVRKLKCGSVGACDPESKLIFIVRGQSPAERYATFWHEVWHAFEEEYKIALGHKRITRMEWNMVDILGLFPHFQVEDVSKRPKP